MLQRFKAAISSEEFKNILHFENLKGTIKSLDNIFYGSMLIAMGMFIFWLYQVMGIWLAIAPVLFIVLCYVGRFIKLLIHSKVIPIPPIEEPMVEENPYVSKPKSPRKKKSS
jgi:hypothetical protein